MPWLPLCSRDPGPVVFGCCCVVQRVGFLVVYLIETLSCTRRSQVTKKQLFLFVLPGGIENPVKTAPIALVPPHLHQAGHFHPKAANVWKVSSRLVSCFGS